MKSLLEKLKAIPKKTLILVGLLVVLSIATLIMSVIVAKQAASSAATVPSGTTGVDVIKESDTSKPEAQKVQLDMSDVYGLLYVSRGDGTCYIAGIGTCTKTELDIPSVSPAGDKVTKINDNAFSGCKELVSISIPASVKTIGTGAFRGCEKLVAISVSSDNDVYCSVSGVLFSKDKTVLLCYPMNRQGSNYLLSTGVKAIGAFAFEGAINLKQLLYEGTVSSFSAIDMLSGNDILDTIAITCNYTAAK
jgi:hypothetical protein